MPNLKKRFDKNSRKRFRNTDNQSRIRFPNGASDVIEAKRMRFMDAQTEIDHLRRSRVEGCSGPGEAREAPLLPVADVGDSKTSEFAYFKKLKKGVGHTSRTNLVHKESTQTRNFGLANNDRELGVQKKFKDVKAPLYLNKSPTPGIGSLLCPEDVSIQSSGMHSKLDDEKLESSSLIRTPTTVDLYSILSTSATASANPEIQLKNGDIFSAKRLKLQQRIVKTLFPEADKLPKESDVVSLLLSRLLPESSLKNPFESKNLRQPELKDKCQERLAKPSTESEESWDGTQKLEQNDVGHLLGDGICRAYRETHPSCQINEDVDTCTTRYADGMVLGFSEGNTLGSSLSETCYESLSDVCGEQKLLTWSNEHCDYSPKRRTSSMFLEDEVHNQLSNGIGSDQSCRFRGHTPSYELPTVSYDWFAEACPRTYPKYKDDPPDCKLDRRALDSWHPVSFERFGYSALGNLRDSAEMNGFADNCLRRSCLEYKYQRPDSRLDRRAPDSWCPVPFERCGPSALSNVRVSAELNEFEMSGEGKPSPLLLTWGTKSTDDTSMSALTHSTDMDLELYPPHSWSEGDQRSLVSSSSLSILPSILPSSSLVYPSPDILQENHTQRHNLLQQKDTVGGSSSAPGNLLYSPDRLSSDDAGFFKDMFRGSRFLVIPEEHNRHLGNMVTESIFPAVGALLISRGLDSDVVLESKSLSEQQYDISTEDVPLLPRLEKPSSQFLYENERGLQMPKPEGWSLMNVHNPALQLNRISWLDTAFEAHYDDCVITTCDSDFIPP